MKPVICRLARRLASLLALAAAPCGAAAQGWQQALSFENQPGTAYVSRVGGLATDALGNVFVTGTFVGTLRFGATQLVSSDDGSPGNGGGTMFLAKWDAQAQAWAWATSGGGPLSTNPYVYSYTAGTGVAVQGNTVYVVGYFRSNTGTRIAGTTLAGAGYVDLFVARYLDLGASFGDGGASSDGGSDGEVATGLAVSGSSLYVVGNYTSSYAAGSNTTLAGTVLPPTTTNRTFLVKYTDTGAGLAGNWATAGGDHSASGGVAVQGSTVYTTGYFSSNVGEVFAGTALAGAGGDDLFLARYLDLGASFGDGGAVSGGGSGNDHGTGVAVSGPNVYVTGDFASGTGASFAGTALPGAGYTDLVLAKYTDLGAGLADGWALSGGGDSYDAGSAVAVAGQRVLVAGTFVAGAVNPTYAGTTLTSAGSAEVFVAKYLDAGPAATDGGAISGGGAGYDVAEALAVSGPLVYVGGLATPPAQFGASMLALPAGNAAGSQVNFLAQLADQGGSLPVTLTSFTAEAAGPAAVALAWATASESSSARFEVERSRDGVRFGVVGTVAAAGTSATTRTYAYLDAAAPAGPLYYRLRQVDVDGTAAYSPVRVVTLAGAGLLVFPNPAPGAATLRGAAPGGAVEVRDVLGQLVATAAAAADGTAALPALPAGLYVVRAGGRAIRWVVE